LIKWTRKSLIWKIYLKVGSVRKKISLK
jgi:hypothetical protein